MSRLFHIFKYFRLKHLIIILSSWIAVLIVGFLQHIVWLGISVNELRVPMFIFPSFVGLTFGTLLARILIYRQMEIEYGKEIAKQQEEINRYNLIHNNPALICGVNCQGKVIFFNPAVEKITGYSIKEISDLNWWKTLYPGELYSQVEKFLMLINQGEVQDYEMIMKTKNGTLITIAWNASFNKDENDNLSEIYIFGHDITKRKATEEELLKFKLGIERSADAIFITDLDGKIVYANPAFQIIYGYTNEEVIGKTPRILKSGLLPPDAYKVFWETLLSKNSVSGEIINKTKDNKLITVDGSNNPILDTGGEIIGFLGIHHDVSQRKMVEEAIKESEEKFREMAELLPEVVFEMDIHGNLTFVNKHGHVTFGYSKIPSTNKMKINQFFNSVELQKIRKDIKLLLNGVPGESKEYFALKKDGTEFPVRIYSSPIIKKNKTIGIRGILVDITEQRKMVQQLQQSQKMEAIGNLAGGIAHDFNNLLTVINGYSDLALSEAKKLNLPNLQKKLDAVYTAGRKAEKLTSQLLAFSRKQIYKPEILDINSTISSLDKMVRRLIGEDIKIETLFEKNIPKIKADSTQIEQIFFNLVVNARDAVYAINKTEFRRKITIETGFENLDNSYVKDHPGSTKGPHVFFSVSDNGIGMTKDTINKIFEPFFTTKERYKGTGLGLSTVYGIIKQNNGYIRVYSEPNTGTMFKIYWPASPLKAKTASKKLVTSEKLTGNESILIVEDDPMVRQYTFETLQSYGYEVSQADNGLAALDEINAGNNTIDLVVTDIIMPEMSGKEFIEKLKKNIPHIKVIYVSGYTDNYVMNNELLEEGAIFIQKPYSIETLVEEIRKSLDN